MVARSVPLLAACLAVACLAVSASAGGVEGDYSSCSLGLAKHTTLIFVADPGTFSATPEAAQYLLNLQRKRALPAGSSACPTGYTGKLLGSDVAVITTGIGPTAAALCVFDVLQRCGSRIKDVFYSGTSGWSAQLGGIINNGSCEAGRANGNGRTVMTGDVCVSPFSVNWDCRQASYSAQCAAGPTQQCAFPQQSGGPAGPANTALFGECAFTNVSRTQLALSDEALTAAAKYAAQLPLRNAVVQALDTQYWSAMQQGVPGVTFPAVNASAPPKVWSYRECMEIDSQFFWSGAPYDMVARSYVAQVLNTALPAGARGQQDVIAVSAMEAIGVGQAMERYNSLASTERRIPYTVVRGASDWVHSPLAYSGGGQWTAGAVIENFAEGYKYAIATASSVVLSTLQARCRASYASAEAGRKACTFVINYS